MSKKLFLCFCFVLFTLAFSFSVFTSVKAEAFTFNNNLRSPITHPDVLELQKFLNTHGFVIATTGPGSPGHETSIFGPRTKVALIKFQLANHISPALGYFGPVTRYAINTVLANIQNNITQTSCKIGDLFNITTGLPCSTKTTSIKSGGGGGGGNSISHVKNIVSFSILGVPGVISDNSIAVTLPYGTNLQNLIPTITVSSGASVSPGNGDAQDFTHAVTYVVAGADGTMKFYTVRVAVALSSEKDITQFTILGIDGTIDEEALPDPTITITLPYETDLKTLTPTINFHGFGINPGDGIEQDFTTPVTYTVTAEDSSTKNYIVTVERAAPSHIATVTSNIYAVSTGGGGNETITIPNNTSKSSFLSALTKEEDHQTWDDSDISNTVQMDDTLVVTAQDAETTIIYTVIVEATTPNIVLTGGDINPATFSSNVQIPILSGTDSHGAISCWAAGSADRIKFTVTDGGDATSTIKINGDDYVSGANYVVLGLGTLPIVVTTTEADKATAVRTFLIAVTHSVDCGIIEEL